MDAPLVATALSAGVSLAALGGLIVAITNLRNAQANCTLRALSIAYIIFFVLTILSAFGGIGLLFRGTDVAGGAGLVISTFSAVSLFVLGGLLVWSARKLTDDKLRKTNYAVFGIFLVLSIVNGGYLLLNRQNLVNSQPANQIRNYVGNRRAIQTPRF